MMTTHRHKHTHESKAGEPSRPKIYLSGLHKDWRTWLVLAIMLAAIGTYVLTLDESIQPGGAVQGGIPATAAPASPSK
ncbi:MAG: hypothetical protein NTW80_12570 [Deltaproteobacteria bacterium]|nr:hypothetical protein [Deltaproteobacteria bacterium]